MKIITNANGKKFVKISRSEWEFIGRAFKVKKAYSAKIKMVKQGQDRGLYITYEELYRRLTALGFVFGQRDYRAPHAFICKYPPKDPFVMNTVAHAQYEDGNGWRNAYRTFRQQSPYITKVIYNRRFVVPPDFHEKAMEEHIKKLEENKPSKPEEPKYEYRNIPFAQIPQELLENNKLKPPNPQNPQKPWEIKTPKGWEREIEGIDYTSNSIMLEDGTIIQYPALDSKVTIRKEIIPEKS